MSVLTDTTNLTPCSSGHDWQFVQWAHSGSSVLVVCRRCAESRWVGGGQA